MFFRALKWGILGVLIIAVMVPGGALLWASHTMNGRIVALACLALGLCLGLVGLFRKSPARWWWCSVVGTGGVGLILSGLALIRAPDGRTVESDRVQNRYTGGGWHFQRYALGNIVPELDQFRLGFSVISCIDPLFDRSQAEALGRWTTAIYDELEADADFHALGSVMPNAYADLCGEFSSMAIIGFIYLRDSTGNRRSQLSCFCMAAGGILRPTRGCCRRSQISLGAW